MKLYPERMRCRRCRRYFAWLVVDRLYDTYECAGRPHPYFTRPWSREHVTRQGEEKRAFFWPEDPEIAKVLAGDRTLGVYQCSQCGNWHVGHKKR